jgi:hypothetical protein
MRSGDDKLHETWHHGDLQSSIYQRQGGPGGEGEDNYGSAVAAAVLVLVVAFPFFGTPRMYGC